MIHEPYNIPENWEWSLLGDVSQKPQYGWTTKASQEGSIHLLRTTDITSGSIDWDTVPFCTNEPDDIDKYLIKDGEIVISRAGSVGYSYYINKPKKTVFASYLIRFKPLINGKYFHFFLQTPLYWNSISEQKLGIAVPNVNATKLSKIPIPIAPLNEQVRIVSKIEELFSQLDNGVKALHESQSLLRHYRQSVMKKAFLGKLTTEWREQNKPINSSQLLESIKKEGINSSEGKYTQTNIEDSSLIKEIPSNWNWTTLPNITLNFDGKRIPVKKDDRKNMSGIYPYYGASGIIDYVDDYLYDGEYLLFSEDGANLIARSTPIAFIAKGKFWVNNHAHVLKTLGNIPLKYLEYYLNYISLHSLITGTAQPKLTQRNMNKIPICIPSLNEQNKIVEILDNVYSVIEINEKNIIDTLKQCEAFKQSILKQAFSGGLLPQDSHDEPASYLLERIKTEKAKIMPTRLRSRQRKSQGDFKFQMTPVRRGALKKKEKELQ